MHQLVKVGIVFSLLIIGIAAALAFRKTPEEDIPTAGNKTGENVAAVADDTPANDTSAGTAQGAVTAGRATLPAGPVRTEDQYKEPAASTLDQPPPSMSAFYPATGRSGLVPLPSTGGSQSPSQPAPAAPMVDVQQHQSPAAPPRRHTIRDGDTLADLARRYLGDARRADEIYQANRDVLDQPDVLPIGTTLVILRQAAAAQAQPSQPARSAVTSDNNSVTVARPSVVAGPLVPVKKP